MPAPPQLTSLVFADIHLPESTLSKFLMILLRKHSYAVTRQKHWRILVAKNQWKFCLSTWRTKTRESDIGASSRWVKSAMRSRFPRYATCWTKPETNASRNTRYGKRSSTQLQRSVSMGAAMLKPSPKGPLSRYGYSRSSSEG